MSALPELFPELAMCRNDGPPEGLVYAPGVFSSGEHDQLMAQIATLEFARFDFHGFQGNRRIVAFGVSYDFAAARVRPSAAAPAWLEPVRKSASRFAGVPADDLVHTLVTEYAPGAGIGWHRDRAEFDKVVGLSFGAPCVMRFRRRQDGGWLRRAQPLAPGSAYLLDGPARDAWQHSIVAGDSMRYSITFRSLR